MRTVGSLDTTTTPIQTKTIQRQLAPADQTLIFRLVGFYEYVQALHHFDVLMKKTSDEEREVINDIVKERDEFAVYTNLSRRLRIGSSSLAERSEKGDDSFERRGLDWVMALARVEVGAMLAGFTNVLSPFETVKPSEFELSAYKELLGDGLRTHYWALANDPQFPRVIAKSKVEPDAQTVAFVRRLSVARAFHDAASRIGAAQLNAQQVAELQSWKNDLDGSQQELIANIEDYLRPITLSRAGPSTTTSKSINSARACSAQLRGERYELSRGTARITTETVN